VNCFERTSSGVSGIFHLVCLCLGGVPVAYTIGDSVDHVIASLCSNGIRAGETAQPAERRQRTGPVSSWLYLPCPRRPHPRTRWMIHRFPVVCAALDHSARNAVELIDIATETMTNSISMERSIRTPPAPIGGRIRRSGLSNGSVTE
jgi:hypothetical protein